MAKLSINVAITFTVLLFLVTVSQARIPSNLLEGEVIDRELPRYRTDSNVISVLRVPSDSVNDESHSTEPAGDIPESEPISVRSIPLRVVRFRPINRHFPIRSRFSLRNCHRRRRHHPHHPNHPFFTPIRHQKQREHVEIPYGNDMILSTDENNEFDPLMSHHGRMRRIPARWAKFQDHHHDDDHDEEGDAGFSKLILKHSHRFGNEKFKKHLHHHKDDQEEENYEEITKKREGKKDEEGGFMNRIRKFLNHF